jgi:hypothetical protein
MTIISDKAKLRMQKINEWCLSHSSDFATNLARDLKSLKALWNYLILALYTWVCCYGVVFHPEACLNTVIVTTGGLVASIFTGYIFAANAEKRAAKTYPAYSNQDTPAQPAATTDTAGDPGNG